MALQLVLFKSAKLRTCPAVMLGAPKVEGYPACRVSTARQGAMLTNDSKGFGAPAMTGTQRPVQARAAVRVRLPTGNLRLGSFIDSG